MISVVTCYGRGQSYIISGPESKRSYAGQSDALCSWITKMRHFCVVWSQFAAKFQPYFAVLLEPNSIIWQALLALLLQLLLGPYSAELRADLFSGVEGWYFRWNTNWWILRASIEQHCKHWFDFIESFAGLKTCCHIYGVVLEHHSPVLQAGCGKHCGTFRALQWSMNGCGNPCKSHLLILTVNNGKLRAQ